MGFTGLVLTLMCISWAQPSSERCPFRLPQGEMRGETLRCLTLRVPESRQGESDTSIEIAVAILHSQQPTSSAPIIYLEGGPGGSALAAIDDWAQSSLREHHDLIIFDQRGTGYSSPVLNCPEIDEDYEAEVEAYAACYERLLAEGIHLASYNSRENAADVADLITALELDAVNLYGISYGTRLALTVMRDHPAKIRSVILDSTYPPQVEGIAEGPRHTQRAFDALFAACRADNACRAAYPRLEEDFYQSISKLQREPYELADGLELTGYDVMSSLFQTMYDTSLIPNLPFAINLLAQESYDDAYSLLTGELTPEDLAANENVLSLLGQLITGIFVVAAAEIDDDAEGVYESIECQEDAAFQTMQMTQGLSKDVHSTLQPLLLEDARLQFEICELWDNGSAEAIENQPVSSDIPTLILAGELDPITPPAWGQEAAAHLSRSQFVSLAGMGHGLIDVHPCVDALVQAFLDQPEAPLDTSCASRITARFYVPR